jgi:group I intron endonuclease
MMSLETKKKMSASKSGSNNFYFGKKLHSSTLLAAQKARGKLIYVYNEIDLSLVNNNPFISIRETAKNLLINPGTLVKKLDSGIPFIGYYYYSKPLVV